MISKKTVFILGAGASAHLGFPLGLGLQNEAIDVLFPNLNPNQKVFDGAKGELPFQENPLYKFFRDAGFSTKFIEEFRIALEQAKYDSIDAFLEHRREFIELGKFVIATILSRYENLEMLYQNAGWYKYVLNKMSASYDKFDHNNVSFITFNYDRSLEVFLLNAMTARYDKSEEECYHKLTEIPIVHLHGKLGKLRVEDPKNFHEYGSDIHNVEAIKLMASKIKIIHDDIPITTDSDFLHAHSLIQEAQRIIFLGFGYDKKNIDRLKISNVSANMFGSCFGYTTLEVNSIVLRFDTVKPILDPSTLGMDCLEFLRNRVQLD